MIRPRKNIAGFLGGFVDAGKGLAESIKTQFNIRFHFIAAILVIALSVYYELNVAEWCFIIISIVIVLMAELLNTAIEYLVDLVSPEYNVLAGKIKDIAASAALIAAIGSAVVGTLIFYPKIFC